MDRMLACEAGDPGSIPGESTENKKLPLLEVFCSLCWTEVCFSVEKQPSQSRENFVLTKTKLFLTTIKNVCWLN